MLIDFEDDFFIYLYSIIFKTIFEYTKKYAFSVSDKVYLSEQ